ncbi:MAG: glycosyltransferase [Candidatus Saccharimonadales bacterium]
MRIVLSSESYWPNKDGGAVFEHRLVSELVAAGHEVAVLAPGQHWRSSIQHDDAGVIYRTPSVVLPFSKRQYRVTYYARSQVRRMMREFCPEVIHIHTMGILGSCLLRAAQRRGLPVVATNHLMPENLLMSMPSWIQKNAWLHRIMWKRIVAFHERCDIVTSPTPSATALLTRYGLTRPLYAISNGMDTTDYRPANPQESSIGVLKDLGIGRRDYVLYLGRIGAEKRIDTLLEAYATLAHEYPTHDLVIAGKGNRLEALQRRARELGCDDRTHFTGLVTDEQKKSLYQQAALYCITSPAELQSITTMEAMASGLPIIAVDVVALHELCHDGKNGYLIPVDDVEACARKLRLLLNDEARRHKFGEWSREYIIAHHDNRRTYEQFTALYHQLICEPPQHT